MRTLKGASGCGHTPLAEQSRAHAEPQPEQTRSCYRCLGPPRQPEVQPSSSKMKPVDRTALSHWALPVCMSAAEASRGTPGSHLSLRTSDQHHHVLAASFKQDASYSLASPGSECLQNGGLYDTGSPWLLLFSTCTRPHSCTLAQKSTCLLHPRLHSHGASPNWKPEISPHPEPESIPASHVTDHFLCPRV